MKAIEHKEKRGVETQERLTFETMGIEMSLQFNPPIQKQPEILEMDHALNLQDDSANTQTLFRATKNGLKLLKLELRASKKSSI